MRVDGQQLFEKCVSDTFLNRVRLGEKSNNLLRTVYVLQRRSEELRHKIGCTDHASECEQLHAGINRLADAAFAMTTSGKGMAWKDLNDMEARFLSLEQEIDLFYKKVTKLARFNEEVREYEKSQNKE